MIRQIADAPVKMRQKGNRGRARCLSGEIGAATFLFACSVPNHPKLRIRASRRAGPFGEHGPFETMVPHLSGLAVMGGKPRSSYHSTQILPKCEPLSWYRNASGSRSNAKLRSMTGRMPDKLSAATKSRSGAGCRR